MRRSLVPLFLLVSLGSADAQNFVSGVIRDEFGGSVSGARVRLESISGAFNQAIVTGEDGRFRFETGRTGRALLTIESPAFERHVKEIATEQRENEDLDIVLSIRTIPQQISVTASGYLEDLDEAARATTVIGRSELDKRLEFSVAESLREVPGVRITQTGGPGSLTNIRIRGLRPQDTAVLIDGMRFRDPSGSQGDATAFIGDMMTVNVSRLEVLRGCGSALYGSNAMGGVVNIVSDSGGGRFRGDWLGEGGGLGFLRSQARLSGGLVQDRLTYSLGVGYVNVLEGVDGDDRARNSSAHGSLQHRFTDTFLLSARIFGANTFVGLNGSPALTPNAPLTGVVHAIPLSGAALRQWDQGLPFDLGNATVFPAANDPDSRRTSWFTSALFAADHQLTPRLHYRIAWQIVDTRRSFPNGPGGIGFQPVGAEVTNQNGRVDTIQGRLNWVSGRHIVSGGAEWEREAFDNGGRSRGLTPAEDSAYLSRVSQRSLAGFVEDRWRLLNDRLQVTFSGRVQRFDLSRPRVSGDLPAYLSAPVSDPAAAFTGDVSVMYRFNATNTKLRAHIGNAYRAPSLYERFGTAYFGGEFLPYGDPRLLPERSVGGDAGIDQYFGNRRARLSATYFYTQLRSVIGFDFSGLINRTTDPFGRTSGYYSTDGGLARGVEVEGQFALWTGFQVTGSYTHTRTLERRSIAAGTLLTPRIFTHMVTLSGSQTWRRFTATANLLAAPEYLGVISGRAVAWPGPRRLDATASYRLAFEKLRPELFGRVENVLGQRYFEDGFQTPRRWAVAGLRLSF